MQILYNWTEDKSSRGSSSGSSSSKTAVDKNKRKTLLHTTQNEATLAEAISSAQTRLSDIKLSTTNGASGAADADSGAGGDNKEEWVSG